MSGTKHGNELHSDRKVLEMLDMRDNGKSGLEIAERYGMTRNAVIGTLHRTVDSSDKYPCECVKAKNKDGGMPNKWWAK